MTPFNQITRRLCGDAERGPSAAVLAVATRDADLVTVRAGYRQTYAVDSGMAPRLLTAPPPAGADDVFDLASLTKVASTTPLLMSAVESGRVDLDAPVRQWLPDFAGTPTVRDLAEHQGGLAEWRPLYADGLHADGPRSAADAVGLVARLPPAYPVGGGRHYSDLGFMLLGEIVAVAYGAPLAEVATREIFAPLGMTRARFRPPGHWPQGPLVATSHGDWYERRMVATGEPYSVDADVEDFPGWRDHTLVGECNDGNAWHAFGGVAGHAGLFGSASDLVALGRALLRSLAGDGPWAPATVAEFFAPGRDPMQGLGFRIWPEYGAVGHPGFTGTRFAVLPERGRVVVLLTNRLHTLGEPISIDDAWHEVLAVAVEGDKLC